MSEGGRVGNVSVPFGEVRNQIAKDLDLGSGRNYDKAKYIYNNAPEELIQKLDDEELSINKAYMMLKEQLIEEKNKAKSLEQKLKKLLATNFGRSKNDPVKQGRVFGEYEKLCGIQHGGARGQIDHLTQE